MEDFQIAKKPRIESSVIAACEQPIDNDDSDKDENDASVDNNCVFCFEPFVAHGKHRVVSLKCGHLFGKSCIEKWVSSNGTCPTCKSKARRGDIHAIFSNNLTVADNSEVERLKEELLALKRENVKLIEQEYRTSMLLKASGLEMEIMKKELFRLQTLQKQSRLQDQSNSIVVHPPTLKRSKKFSFSQSWQPYSHEKNTLKHLDYDPLHDTILVSRSSLMGNGIVKLPAENVQCRDFIPCHEKQIRAMKSSMHDFGYVLTGSLDKKLKLTSISQNSMISR
jgi:E3 ubiquitin-protein ligase RFWD3